MGKRGMGGRGRGNGKRGSRLAGKGKGEAKEDEKNAVGRREGIRQPPTTRLRIDPVRVQYTRALLSHSRRGKCALRVGRPPSFPARPC